MGDQASARSVHTCKSRKNHLVLLVQIWVVDAAIRETSSFPSSGIDTTAVLQ